MTLQVTLTEAAVILGVTADNLRGAIARGSLKAVKHGRDWWVSAGEVERYRRENRRAGAPSTFEAHYHSVKHDDWWWEDGCPISQREADAERVPAEPGADPALQRAIDRLRMIHRKEPMRGIEADHCVACRTGAWPCDVYLVVERLGARESG